MRKNVALIFGGEGKESEISRKSAKSLLSYIDRKLYTPLPIEIKNTGEWYISCGSGRSVTYPVYIDGKSGFISDGGIIPVSLAFICLHGDMGEDGNVQGALTCAHIPYIGQDTYASALTCDKAYTKIIAEYLKIPTAPFKIFINEDVKTAKETAEEYLGYPMFLKPARLGSSFGASPVISSSDFEKAYLDAAEFDGRVLAEKLISFEYELECAFFEDKNKYFIPDGRILTDGDFYGYKEKYGENSPKTETNPKNDGAARLAASYSSSLAKLLGIKRLSRFDYFVTHDGAVLFNEINTIPGMTEKSLYPALTENIGLRKGDFVNRLIAEMLS